MLSEVYDYSSIFLVASGFVVITSVIAWFAGYYRIPAPREARHISIGSVLLAFFLYFFVQLILIPGALLAWVYLTTGIIPRKLGSVISKVELGWINIALILISTAVVFVVSIVFGKNIRKTIWNFGGLKFGKIVKSAFIGMVTWLLAYPWVVIISQFVAIAMILWYGEAPPNTDQEMLKYMKEITAYKPLFFSTIATVIFIVPIGEELLFRGFLQNWLRTFLPLSLSIIFTSILFASLHFSFGQGLLNWQLIPGLFALSCYLGYVYERQQCLIASIFLHMTVNGISIAITFF